MSGDLLLAPYKGAAEAAGLTGEEKSEKADGKNIFMEIFEFIDNLVIGEANKAPKDTLPTLLTSSNTIEAVSMRVQNVFEKHTSMIDQSLTVNKNIYIDCGDAPLTDYHLKPGKKKYTWLGNEIPGTGCINFGCCYDVSQTSQITLSSVNSSILDKSTEMWNEMAAEVDVRLQGTIDTTKSSNSDKLAGEIGLGILTMGTYQGAKALDILPKKYDPLSSAGEGANPLSVQSTAISSSKDITIEKIEKEFENLVNTDYEGGQDIYIKVRGPLVCTNTCDETPTVGTINQSINIDIATKNIVSQFISTIIKNEQELSVDSDVSASNVDISKMYAFCIISVIFVLFVQTVGRLIVCNATGVLAPLRALCIGPGPGHIGGVLLVFIIFWSWKLISCIVRGNIMSCLF
jgi:hypothetical protein